MEQKKYRVFTEGVHEYNIHVDVNKNGYDIYILVRSGSNWTEDARNEIVLNIYNDGNGYHFSKISKHMDYAETLELQILLQFISWYESKDSNAKETVTIESCKERVRFSI